MSRLKTHRTESKKNSHDGPSRYPKFKSINGEHQLQKSVPGSFVEYNARTRHGGKVAFFNYDLAAELGLIKKDHPKQMNAELEAQILETFSIIIINEYDLLNKVKFSPEDVKPNKYMATRYLQLQHPTKRGKTSGDGRSIWNGQITHEGKTYDISSCGTGATCLSPATHIKKKFFQSGDPSISYGCGYSELDEGLSTLFFSEVFNRNHIQTERVLAIIEFAKGISINVRVNENLLRPSHLFAALKQGDFDRLKNLVDYYIDRQEQNGAWKDVPQKTNERYHYFLDRQTQVFASMAARFEDDYVFCWLDWDGDNILMNGGIIDYGSIRQFGLFHHEYRFDDVQRYSTTILEQKFKARYTVQNFIQIVDFLVTGKKKNINKFAKHGHLKIFDKTFEDCKNQNFVHKLGLNATQQSFLLKAFKKDVEEFRKVFGHFEKAKSVKGKHKVADGINWSAIFCMRDILRELPQLYLARNSAISDQEFIEILKSKYATKADLVISEHRSKRIREFQKYYLKLVDIIAKVSKTTRQNVLLEMSMRSSVINKYDRVTGDSITHVVYRIMGLRPKLSEEKIYQLLTEFVEYQNLDPDHKLGRGPMGKHIPPLKGILRIVRECREGL